MPMAIRRMAVTGLASLSLFVGSLAPGRGLRDRRRRSQSVWSRRSVGSSQRDCSWRQRTMGGEAPGALIEAGFRPGATDGTFSQATLGAVYAFQKLHELDRDGVFRAEHWDLLDSRPNCPTWTTTQRVEVDHWQADPLFVKDASRSKQFCRSHPETAARIGVRADRPYEPGLRKVTTSSTNESTAGESPIWEAYTDLSTSGAVTPSTGRSASRPIRPRMDVFESSFTIWIS